jgi:hypothetical protein
MRGMCHSAENIQRLQDSLAALGPPCVRFRRKPGRWLWSTAQYEANP